MKNLLLITDSTANKISYYHLLLLMGSLPFDMFYSHLILVSFALHTLIHLKREYIRSVFSLKVLALQSVFFVALLSMFYTIDRADAYSELGRLVPVLILPVLFCLNGLDIHKYRSQLLLGFSLVCTATIIYLYGDAFFTIRHYNLPLKNIFSATFTNHNFSEPIAMHATFFSLQVAIALVYMLTVLITERSNYYRLFYLLCACILAAGLIQLSSKSVCMVVFVVVNLAIPFLLLKGAGRYKFMATSLFVSALVVGGIFTLSSLKTRYVSDLTADLKHTPPNKIIDSRRDRWSVALGVIKQAPIAGHGAGSEIGLMHEAFFAQKYYNSFINKLNAHSQYLSFLIKSGIIGLLVYLATLAFGFTIALQKKDVLFIAFMLLITVVSFSENVLDVDKGVLFYACFFCVFMLSAKGLTNENPVV